MKILLLSPHSDDIEFGCGGMLAKLIEEGEHKFHWLTFTDGGGTKEEALRSIADLGLDENNCIFRYLKFKGRHLNESRQAILDLLVSIRNEFNPELVIAPSLNDFHQDHTVVANEMVRAFKKHASLISYELPWNQISFATQLFITLEKRHIEKKVKALMNYKSQIMEGKNFFDEEFIFGLAKIRGVQANAEYSESFEILRWIIR